MKLLQVDDLRLSFETDRGPLQALRGVSFSLAPGESLGLVGESGSGKSLTSLSLMDLLPPNGRIDARAIRWSGPRRAAMIFQDPMTSLNPAFTVEFQMREALKMHSSKPSSEWHAECLRLLEAVGIPEAGARLQAYPHQLSGGMAQRVMIALALACEPEILIADEPTTALDVTIQAQVLSLIRGIRRDRKLSLILVSHDLGVVAQNVDRVAVMYAGEVVEEGPVEDVVRRPRHPYTRALLECRPQAHGGVTTGRRRLPSIPGLVPDLWARPPGCQFQPRCPLAEAACERPIALERDGDRAVRCWKT